jgi:hypothetical protein
MKKKAARRGGDRVTYRDLRNTPGQVWERLARHQVLTLVAEGEAKALLLPIPDGDARSAYEAYIRGRAMLAAARMRRRARASGGDKMTLADINALIRTARAAGARGA